jgi:hypothetical protein
MLFLSPLRVRMPCALSAGAAMLFAGLAQAQHDHAMPTVSSASATMASAAPGDLAAAMPLQFESVLSRYKAMTDQKLGSWREANDTVTRIGGWRTYLKESQAPDVVTPTAPSAGSAPATPQPPPAPNPHAGHGAKP